MTENAETTEKVAKKKAAKKKAAPARKPAAKKATKKTARKAPAREKPAVAAPETKKRGRPAGKKTARKASANGRRKKVKQFAYMLLTPQEGGEMKAGQINGPFASEKDALDDASIMADDTMTVVLFREAKRGKVQKSTKFVAGR